MLSDAHSAFCEMTAYGTSARAATRGALTSAPLESVSRSRTDTVTGLASGGGGGTSGATGSDGAGVGSGAFSSTGVTTGTGGGCGAAIGTGAGLGALVGALAFWLDGWNVPHAPSEGASSGETYLFGTVQVPPDSLSAGLKYLLYFAGVMGAGRWWKAAARDRKDRFTLLPPIAAAFWGAVLVFLWPWQSGSPVVGGIVPLVLATVAVQASSAWNPPPPPAPKRLRFRPA